MSIMDVFKGFLPAQPVQQQTAKQPTPPGNIPASAANAVANPTEGTAANGLIPAVEEKSALDAFKHLWDNDPNKKPDSNVLFNIDQAKLIEAAKKDSYTSGVTKEQMAAIAQGGEAAVTAFMEALNTVAAEVYAKAAFVSTKLVEDGIGTASQRLDSRLPGMIKKHQVRDDLRSENPAFSHPAMKPVIQALENQLVTKYPDATSTELRSLAIDFLEGMSNQIAAPKNARETAKATAAKSGTNWEEWLNT